MKKPSNYKPVGRPRRLNGDRGAAGEHYVISELLRQGFLVGRPCNPVSKHDLFVKAGGKWRTIQIKVGRVYLKTGRLHFDRRKRTGGIISDLIAVVDLEGKRLRWISNTAEAVPEELL